MCVCVCVCVRERERERERESVCVCVAIGSTPHLLALESLGVCLCMSVSVPRKKVVSVPKKGSWSVLCMSVS